MITITSRKSLTSALRSLRFETRSGFSDYAWPGGYTVIFVCHDSEVAHPSCVAKNLKDALSRTAGDRFVACVTYDEGPVLECLYCERPIDSSYGDPENEA